MARTDPDLSAVHAKSERALFEHLRTDVALGQTFADAAKLSWKLAILSALKAEDGSAAIAWLWRSLKDVEHR
jgi:hypothetical protein